MRCVDSWIKENPGWKVFILDANTVHDYVHLEVPEKIMGKLSLAHQSDLIRLSLLSNHGGVWVDATTFCINPLHGWIDDHCKSGFFAFHRPTREKLLSNWFIAASKECPISSRLLEAACMVLDPE
jgi:mannosyltransferase OCH1-like enzyme